MRCPLIPHDGCIRHCCGCRLTAGHSQLLAFYFVLLKEITPRRDTLQRFRQRTVGSVSSNKAFPLLPRGSTVSHPHKDHKQLKKALQARLDRYSPRQIRHLDYIAQFTSTIRHVHGQDNAVSDALSRAANNALLTGQPPVIDFADNGHSNSCTAILSQHVPKGVSHSPEHVSWYHSLRYVNWCSSPIGTPRVVTYCVRLCSWLISPMSPSNTTTRHCSLHVAENER